MGLEKSQRGAQQRAQMLLPWLHCRRHQLHTGAEPAGILLHRMRMRMRLAGSSSQSVGRLLLQRKQQLRRGAGAKQTLQVTVTVVRAARAVVFGDAFAALSSTSSSSSSSSSHCTIKQVCSSRRPISPPQKHTHQQHRVTHARHTAQCVTARRRAAQCKTKLCVNIGIGGQRGCTRP